MIKQIGGKKMEEERTTEQPTVEPEATPEPISDEPGAEISPEAPEVETKTVQEQLAQHVKACFIEGKGCKGLGNKFDEVAKELNIEVDELIDEVFELVNPKAD